MGLWRWLTTSNNANAVSAVISGLQLLGLAFGVVALFLAKAQIDAAQDSLKGTLTAQIQKDGRDLFGAMEVDVVSYIYGHSATRTYPEETVVNARRRIGQVLSFYSAASRQNDKNRIDAEQWQSIYAEFCGFLKLTPVRRQWEEAVRLKLYTDKFREAGERCGTTNTPR